MGWNENAQSYFTSQSFVFNYTQPFTTEGDDKKFDKKLGIPLSISNAGHVIAVDQKIDGKHFVIVYMYQATPGLNNRYNILGTPIPGCCGLLSGDGKLLLISSIGVGVVPTCQVYYWHNNGKWIERGSRLDGTGFALSGDGLTLSVSMTNTSLIETYSWNENQWIHQGNVARTRGEVSVVLSNKVNGTET